VFVSFEKTAFEDYCAWALDDIKIHVKINALIKETMRDPFHGTGKPEPLKGNWSGHWSRRISKEHRLVYKIQNDQVVIASCKFHY
jgi:toxin YoeB